MKCPKCRNRELRQQTLKHGLKIDTCPACRGVWLDRGELLRLTSFRQSARAYVEQLTWDSTEVDRLCPHCRARMLQGRFEGSQVDLDYCNQCEGLWFDASELKKTVAFLETTEPDSNEETYAETLGLDRLRTRREKPSSPTGKTPGIIDAIARALSPRFRLLSSAVPLSETGDDLHGYAIVSGRVVLSEDRLQSPLTRTACACYHGGTKREYRDWVPVDRQGRELKNSSQKRTWRATYRDVTKTEKLDGEWHFATCLLQDRAGTIVAEIDLHGADLHVIPKQERKREIMGATEVLIETEDVYLAEGDAVHVLGKFSRRADDIAQFCTDETPLLISDRSLNELLAPYRRRVWIGLIVAALVVIVILASIVGLLRS